MDIYVGENRHVKGDYELFVQGANGVLITLVDGEYACPSNWILNKLTTNIDNALSIIDDIEIGEGEE